MQMFLKNEAFHFGRQTSDTVDELRAQIEQLRSNLDSLARELADVRVELVLVEILASSPSPSTMKRTSSPDLSILDCCGLGENCPAEANAPSEGSYLFKTFPNRDRQAYRFASARSP